MNTKQVVKNSLFERISEMESFINDAKLCLEDGEYLDCAVRLQSAATLAEFDTLLLNIFDSISGEDSCIDNLD